MHHLLVRSIICWCDLNKITYGLDWCDLNHGPRSHSKCLSARISDRILSSVSALKSWRQEKYNDGMKGLCNSHLVTTWSSAQDLIRSHRGCFPALPFLVCPLMFLKAVPRRNGSGCGSTLDRKVTTKAALEVGSLAVL